MTSKRGTTASGGRDGSRATAVGPEEGDPARPELMATLRRFERAHRLRSASLMRSCFRDDALVESVASNGCILGPDETVQAIDEALRDGAYVIDDWRYQTVAAATVLSTTRARHRLPTGAMRDETVHRLISGREGLMWRVRLFRSPDEALAHFRRHGEGLGL
jgi:hypothetical protein